MASLAGKTKTIRLSKKRSNNEGKRARRRNGSTPKFPIHKDAKKA
jgi:hypothetical protein